MHIIKGSLQHIIICLNPNIFQVNNNFTKKKNDFYDISKQINFEIVYRTIKKYKNKFTNINILINTNFEKTLLKDKGY